jgi:hypothetical protein
MFTGDNKTDISSISFQDLRLWIANMYLVIKRGFYMQCEKAEAVNL